MLERAVLTIAGIVGVAVIALVALFVSGWMRSWCTPAASMSPRCSARGRRRAA